MTTTMITVLLNETTDERGRNPGFFGYEPANHVLRPALMVTPAQIDRTPSASDISILERMYHLLNVGDDPDFGTPHPVAVAYRERQNRSLSVGDIVAIDNRWYTCASFGWQALRPSADGSIEVGDV